MVQLLHSILLQIVKEFSRREEERLLGAVSLASPTAYRYLRRIPRDTWRSTQSRQEELARRYGIVTSNTSEATSRVPI